MNFIIPEEINVYRVELDTFIDELIQPVASP